MESEKSVEAVESPELAEQDDATETTRFTGYTNATVEFLNELPAHVNDTTWHQTNRDRYCNVLRDPTRRLVEMLRSKYIERLSPEVAGAPRPISVLKKNDFGQGGYNAHYWFAFYDPNAGSRTKSVQLIFGVQAIQQLWKYGLSMGDHADQYLQRLQSAWNNNSEAVASYIRNSPQGTIVDLYRGDSKERMTPDSFADLLRTDSDSPSLFQGLWRVDVIQEFPLHSLLEHADNLVNEVGEFFTWAWPLFESSRTGQWPQSMTPPVREDVDPDVEIPATLEALSADTCLRLSFLEDLERALLAKQQVVLVGPPGTSKTYIARKFARYFVAQYHGRPQGRQDVLYMHASWTYEDFFEGIKPTAGKDGALTFQVKKGVFLKWTEQAEGKNHTTINVDLGKPDDRPTQELWVFLTGVLEKADKGAKMRTLQHFQKTLDKTFTPAKAVAAFGEPDRKLGSGLIIYEYNLDDGTKMRLGFPGFAPIQYAHHVQKDGKFEVIPVK